MPVAVTTLYRPVGQAEFHLIQASGFRAFPPRLAHQPIFYAVVTEQYATQIARDWNTKDEASSFIGYVLGFDVQEEFLSRYQIRTVGDSRHQEYWISATELKEFNQHIVGRIQVLAVHRSL